MTQKPARKGPAYSTKTDPLYGQGTLALLAASPTRAKKERQRPLGSASIASSKNGPQRKRDKRKQSISQLSNPAAV